MVLMKEFYEKVDFGKNQQTIKKHEKFPRGQRVNKRIHQSMILRGGSRISGKGVHMYKGVGFD